jgi:hypothetical protein
MFFDRFSKVQYDPNLIGHHNAVNILNSVMMKYSPIKDTTLYFYHSIIDGEKPEDVAYKHYKTTKYYWTIILLNDIINPYYDWMLSATELESHMEDKYGDVLYSAHHFLNLLTDKRIDEYDELQYREMIENDEALPVHISPISNRIYEIELNEEKRQVKVISPKHIRDIIYQFDKLMSDTITVRQ